jgi:hypothetical protein
VGEDQWLAVARAALQHGVVQLCGQADQQRQAALDGVQGLAEGFELFFVAPSPSDGSA